MASPAGGYIPGERCCVGFLETGFDDSKMIDAYWLMKVYSQRYFS